MPCHLFLAFMIVQVGIDSHTLRLKLIPFQLLQMDIKLKVLHSKCFVIKIWYSTCTNSETIWSCKRQHSYTGTLSNIHACTYSIASWQCETMASIWYNSTCTFRKELSLHSRGSAILKRIKHVWSEPNFKTLWWTGYNWKCPECQSETIL